MNEYEATCSLCSWREEYLVREQAEHAAVWHVFEQHRENWNDVIGGRFPRDPRPEEAFRV
jgi:hypothetical protein